MAAKRGQGEGTIQERGPGRYRLRWTAPPDPLTGERQRRTEEFRGTKTDARKRLARLVSSARPSSDITLRAAIELWRAQARHELATAKRYDDAVRWLPASLLDSPIRDITPATLRALIARTVEDHNVHRSRLLHATVSGALTYATRLELIDRNPARLVTIPAQPDREPTAPTTDEIRSLLAKVNDDPQLMCWLRLAAVVGGRPSEVLALRWADIDLEAGSVWVAAALDPRRQRKDTKNHQHRRVALAAETLAAVKRWRRAAIERALSIGVTLDPTAYVLSLDPVGSTPWTRNYATRRFAKLRTSAGVRDVVRLYDLRHYMATTLTAAGVDAKTVANRAGHRRVATTTDIYSHAIPANDHAAAELLDGALSVAGAGRRRSVIARRRAPA